jgi:hypothetical protein
VSPEEDDAKEENPGALRILSMRGTRIDGLVKCDECREKPAYIFYKESSRGPVSLCKVCQGEATNRSWRYRDAMSGARSGGAFETNRRRF